MQWGCQRGIAKKIIDKKADYIIALNCNQGEPHEDVKVFAAEQKANGFRCYEGGQLAL
jgi:predicted transposase YbfD/YdcC